MSKVTPFRSAGKRRRRRRPRPTDPSQPRAQPSEKNEADMVTIILDDGTSQTISGTHLEVDMEYKDGVPYLIVREKD